MRIRFLWTLGIILSLLVIAFAAQRLAESRMWLANRSKIAAADFPKVLHFGAHSLGDQAVQRFAVANTGTSELVIDRIESSCSCTGMEIERDGRYSPVTTLRVAPGASNSVVMRVAVRGSLVGTEMHNIVKFRTNDPQLPHAQIEAVVPIVGGSLSFQPRAVVFGTIQVGAGYRCLVDVFASAKEKPVIANVTTSNPDQIRVHVTEVQTPNTAPGRTNDGEHVARLEVIVDSSEPAEIDALATVFLSGDLHRPQSFSITGRIANPIEIAPKSLVFPRHTTDGPKFTSMVLCRSTTGRPLDVTIDSVPKDVICDSDGCAAGRIRATVECYHQQCRAGCPPRQRFPCRPSPVSSR